MPFASRKPKCIQALPADIILVIVSFITVKDILALRQTCKPFYGLTKLRWVWADAVKRHVISKGLPVPAAKFGIQSFSAEHLETRAVHAAKLHDNWYSKHPKPRQAVEFQLDRVDDDEHPPKVDQVLFLPGRSGEFLVTLAGGVITCWEVPMDGSGAYQVARWDHDNAVEQIIVNQDPNHDVEIAYWSVDPALHSMATVYTLSLDTFHGCFKPRYALRAARHQVSPLHLMHGDDLIVGDPMVFWYTKGGGQPTSQITKLFNNPVYEIDNSPLAVKYVGSYIFVVRVREIQVFRKGLMAPYLSPDKHVASLPMAWPAMEAVIVTRWSDDEGFSKACPGPVTVLARCADDGFNTLRQYDFLPNTQKVHMPEYPGILPWIFPEKYTRTIGVAPSSCRLTVGRSGKGFWIQTSNVESKHCSYPARCLMGFDVSSPSPGGTPTAPEEKSISWQAQGGGDLHLCESQLYARRCDMGEILRKKYAVHTADIEDVLGRIAVGDTRGKIEVLDYA